MNEPNKTSQLVEKKCQPCGQGTNPFKGATLKEFSAQLGEGWRVVEEHHLEKDYSFKNFREALAFTNRIGEIAEAENHHPDILLTWGKVGLKIWTHSVGGLSENDFILAAKADQAL